MPPCCRNCSLGPPIKLAQLTSSEYISWHASTNRQEQQSSKGNRNLLSSFFYLQHRNESLASRSFNFARCLCLLPSAFCFLLVPLRQLLCGLLPYKVGPMAPQTAPSPPLRSPPVLGTQRSRPLRLRRNFMGIHLVFGSVLACLRHAALLWFQHLRFYIMIYVCRVYVCVQSVCVCGYLHCAKAICTA